MEVIDQFAVGYRGPGCGEPRADRIPPAILRTLNLRRQERGLPALGWSRAVAMAAPVLEPAGPGSWIDPRSSLAPAGRPPAGGYWPLSAAQVVTRVLLVGDGGTARCKVSAEFSGGERVANGAYGDTVWLNKRKGWYLADGGHEEASIAWAGPRLRAIASTAVPLLVEWLPDMKLRRHREIVERIESGECAVSLRSRIREDCLVRIPGATRLIKSASLVHIALLRGELAAAYPGAHARVFRKCSLGGGELADQVATMVKAAQHRAVNADLAAARRR